MLASEVAADRTPTAGPPDREPQPVRARLDLETRGRARTVATTGILALAITATAASSQEEPPTFAESAEVTAFDLVVGVEGGGRAAVSFEPAELRLSVGGEAVTVDKVHPGVELTRRPIAGDDTWSILIWLAADLSSNYQLRWAAASLSQLTSELTALGDVELVMGDPEPRRLLPPTRDAAAVEAALSRLAVESLGNDRLAALRYDYVAERTAPTLDIEEVELARAFAAEEERLVLAHQDALLLALDERSAGSRRRRLLLLVSGGFDPWPDSAYEAAVERRADEETLAGETEAWLRSLAAYGWITVPVLAPALDHPLRGGFTLGKLRLFWGGPAGMMGVHGGFEEDRDPERAAAYVLLGRSLRAEGRLEDAAEAFERALYHYYDDRKTTEEQGIVWLELGSTLSQLGAGPAALEAWQLGARRLCAGEAGRARSITPSDTCIPAALSQTVPSPSLLARSGLQGEQILQQVAAITGAFVASEREPLLGQLADLAGRARITFQASALEPGRLFPVELSRIGKTQVLLHPRWVRSGSAERLANARLRHLLTEGPLEDDSGLLAHRVAHPSSVLLVLPAALVPEEPGGPETARLSWAWTHEDGVRTHHELRSPPPAGHRWQLEDAPIPAGSEGVVMVELLSSGMWGSAPCER